MLRGLAFVLLIVLLPSTLLAQTEPATQPAVTLAAEIGYGGVWRAGTWTPVTTRFSAPEVQGAWLEISAEAAPGRVLRTRQQVTLSPTPQSVQSLLPIGFAAQEIRVRLARSDTGETLARFAFTPEEAAALVPVANERLAVFSGVGASNAAATLIHESSITATAEAPQRLPAALEAYLGVDALVLLDVTDLDPPTQAALLAWVRLGGELIVVAGESPLPAWLETIVGGPLGPPEPLGDDMPGVQREVPGTRTEIDGGVYVVRHSRDRGAITFVNADPTVLARAVQTRGRAAWLKILAPAIAGRMSAAYRDPVHQPLTDGLPSPKPPLHVPWLLIGGLFALLAIDGLVLSRRPAMRLIGGVALAVTTASLLLQWRQPERGRPDRVTVTLIEQTADAPLLQTDLIVVAAGEASLESREGWWSVAAADELNRSGYSELWSHQTQTGNPPGNVFVSDASVTTLIGRHAADAVPLRLTLQGGQILVENRSQAAATEVSARLADGSVAMLDRLEPGQTAALQAINRLPQARKVRLLDSLHPAGQHVVIARIGDSSYVRATIVAE